jgi:hypothetical protein
MTDVFHLSDFPSCVADCVNGMTGTDNTAALNAVIASIPAGAELVISPHAAQGGDGPGYGFVSTLIVDHPIKLTGTSMFSRLVPLAGFNLAAPNFHVIENDYYWEGIEWKGVQIGTSPFNPPFSRNGGDGIFVDGVSIPAMDWTDLMIGESGNGYGLHITGAGTQHHTVSGGQHDGGIFFDGVADGHIVQNVKAIGGRTPVSGVRVYMPGAGSFQLKGCPSITAPGGVVVQGGSMPVIEDCFFEEEPGYPINNYANGGGYNGAVSFVGYPGNVYAGRIVRCIFNIAQSGVGGFDVPGATGYCINLNPAVHGVANTVIDECEFVLSTNRGYINSQDPNLTIGANNKVQPGWLLMSPGSVAPTQTYAGG